MSKMCDLTNEDIVRLVTDIFQPKRITRIQRHKRDDCITCNIYTEWTSKGDDGKEDTVTCCDELEMRNPFENGKDALFCGDVPLNADDYTKLKQFCFAHGMMPEWMKNNPYTAEKNKEKTAI